MALPVVFTFQSSVATSICNTQTAASGVALLINGALLDTAATANGIFRAIIPGVERTVTITSSAGDDLSTVVFTIAGYDVRGKAVTAAITGPASTSVTSTPFYHQITSITPGAAVNSGVQIGTGATGGSKWFWPDTWQAPTAITLGVTVSGTITYTVVNTFSDVQETGSGPTFSHATLVAQSTSLQSNYAFYPGYFRALIQSSSASGALTYTVVQASNG